MDHTKLVPVAIQAKTEQLLQQKLIKLQLEMGKMLNVINIYPKGGYIYAWLFIDSSRFSISSVSSKEKDELLNGKQPPKAKKPRTKKAKK